MTVLVLVTHASSLVCPHVACLASNLRSRDLHPAESPLGADALEKYQQIAVVMLTEVVLEIFLPERCEELNHLPLIA